MLASLAGPFEADEPASGTISTFWVQTSTGPIGVPVDQIEWIEASRDYSVLHTSRGNHVLRQTMASLERGLDSAIMLRVHRSAFVAIAAVRAVERLGRRTVLTLRSGVSIHVSAGYVSVVRAKLGAVLPGRRVELRPERSRPTALASHVRGRSVPRPSASQRRSSC